jgi:cysteine-rich repeat protein
MRLASVGTVGLACLVCACGSGEPGVFGESSVAGQGSGGGSGDGGSASSPTSGPGPSTSSTDAGPGSSGATNPTTSSSGDGGAGSAVTVGPGSSVSTADVVSSTAAGPSCGNGVVDGSDFCDGADLDAQSCTSLGYAGGALACTDACTFDASDCTSCGNGSIEGGEQCDDGDLDSGDGCDAGCFFEGTSCDDPIEIDIERDEVVTVATTNEAGDSAPGTCIDATGPGRVFRVVARDDGFLRVWVKRSGSTMDTSLRMGFSCDDTFVCADSYDPFAQNGDPPTAGGEVGAVAVDQDQAVYVFVEAWEADLVGTFEIEMTLTRGRCGEPVVIPVEAGSSSGITAWGFNGQQESSATGTCGGAGRDVVYRLRPVGNVGFVDQVSLEVVPSFSFNPVLHARSGACGQITDQIACTNNAGNGGDEAIDGFEIQDDPEQSAWVFADSVQSSNGGFVLRVVPPAP